MNNSTNTELHMNVTISNLQATDDEIKKLENLLLKNFGAISTAPKTNLEREYNEKKFYKVIFTVTETKFFDLKSVQELLYSLVLVGWSIDGTFFQVEKLA